jgi:chloramphenicol O-acetyltransferase
MTINILNTNLEQNFDVFSKMVTHQIERLEQNKTIKFKTNKGVLAVNRNKKQGSIKFETCVTDGSEFETRHDGGKPLCS